MSALADYYRAMTAEKQAGIGLTNAQTNLANEQVKYVGDQATANVRDTLSKAYLANEQGKVLGPEAAANNAYRRSLTATNDAGLQVAGQVDPGYGDVADTLARAGIRAAGSNTGLLPGDVGYQPGASVTGRPPPANSSAGILQNNPAVRGLVGGTVGPGILSPNYTYPSITSLTPNAGTTPPRPQKTSSLTDDAEDPSSVQVFAATGTADVEKGKKVGAPNKSDTIAAKLSPGESVLNRGATEHLGGDVIDHLNKLGMMRMAAQKELQAHHDAVHSHTLASVLSTVQGQTKKQGKKKAA